MTEDVAKLNSLLEKAKNELTEDEVITLFDLTRKRIQEIEEKAVNRLNKNKSDPEER
jgi:DNA-directed RNA polymerase sigma subunit (sigma70/sigma32)